MNVVIVESVAKAKAINKYLGSRYKVLASYGHVRDLPSKDGSVEPDKDFAMHWDVDGKSSKVMREIADAVKNADKLILATDPDREGEAISWHILRILEDKKALKKGVPVERVTFNAVTKQSVLDAFKTPRAIDAPLVANMTEFGKSPLLGAQELGEMGYRMVIFPQSAFRVSMKTTEEFFRALKAAGSPNDWLDRMQTRQELYTTLDYDPAAESWPGYRVAR